MTRRRTTARRILTSYLGFEPEKINNPGRQLIAVAGLRGTSGYARRSIVRGGWRFKRVCEFRVDWRKMRASGARRVLMEKPCTDRPAQHDRPCAAVDYLRGMAFRERVCESRVDWPRMRASGARRVLMEKPCACWAVRQAVRGGRLSAGDGVPTARANSASIGGECARRALCGAHEFRWKSLALTGLRSMTGHARRSIVRVGWRSDGACEFRVDWR